jgi:hypothetical protein
MADKLYFMVRDLYAIHTNVLRRQLENQKNFNSQPPFPSQQAPKPPHLNNFEPHKQHQPQNTQGQFSFDLLQQQHQHQQQQQQYQQFQQFQPQQSYLPYQQFQLQHITTTDNDSSTINSAMVDWTLSYYNAAMVYETPGGGSSNILLNSDGDLPLNNFQIPENPDQNSIFNSDSLT